VASDSAPIRKMHLVSLFTTAGFPNTSSGWDKLAIAASSWYSLAARGLKMFWIIVLASVVTAAISVIGIIWLPTLQLLIVVRILILTGRGETSKPRPTFLLVSHVGTFFVADLAGLLIGSLILRGTVSTNFFWLLAVLVLAISFYWVVQILLRAPPMLARSGRILPETP
jgi:hypothetical protein